MVESHDDKADAPPRKIIHVDMDAFYASVEQRDDPALRGRPVIVAWEGPRSVVCAASYEARRFGVRSAIPALRARKLCPEGVFVAPNFEKYRAVSSAIGEIFRRHTPLVEFLSLDEAYLDVTVELTGIETATETAKVIRREIREETGLTASAGVAPNKFLAKIASDWKKPDGLFVIRPSQVDAFLQPLPVGKIPGVGHATEMVLTEMGIATIGDVRAQSEEALVRRLGSFGHRLHELAFGVDRSQVISEHETKSVSIENTFARDLTLDEIREELRSSIPRFWERMSSKGLVGRTVTVKLRAADFRTATRRMTLPAPPASGDELYAAGAELLGRFEFGEGTLYRLVGIGLSNFGPVDETPQRALFG
ncbi:MAG: DNA polymerase IV [Thermoanaerobaculia bacterium]|jgi:DNA polymerase-4